MKWDRDIRHAAEAQAMNAELLHTRIEVIGGGRKGPFTVRVDRLGRRQVKTVVDAILEALGQERRPPEGTP